MKFLCALLWGAVALLIWPTEAWSQGKIAEEKILFTNPSFEDTPRAGASPAGWFSGTPGSTPDIMPGAWGLELPAYQGKTCLGLVTREDGTTEDVAQRLSTPLRKGNCYTFTVYLSHAATYVGYNQAARLRIWGGYGAAQKQELLDSSPVIEHANWKVYQFQFVPQRDINHLIFEAYFAPTTTARYKGNLLLDNCSAIIRCTGA